MRQQDRLRGAEPRGCVTVTAAEQVHGRQLDETDALTAQADRNRRPLQGVRRAFGWLGLGVRMGT